MLNEWMVSKTEGRKMAQDMVQFSKDKSPVTEIIKGTCPPNKKKKYVVTSAFPPP